MSLFNNQEKNLIFINQSSSLALRMSIFNNKNQIFIDKYNLSIVPQFLKKFIIIFQ